MLDETVFGVLKNVGAQMDYGGAQIYTFIYNIYFWRKVNFLCSLSLHYCVVHKAQEKRSKTNILHMFLCAKNNSTYMLMLDGDEDAT